MDDVLDDENKKFVGFLKKILVVVLRMIIVEKKYILSFDKIYNKEMQLLLRILGFKITTNIHWPRIVNIQKNDKFISYLKNINIIKMIDGMNYMHFPYFIKNIYPKIRKGEYKIYKNDYSYVESDYKKGKKNDEDTRYVLVPYKDYGVKMLLPVDVKYSNVFANNITYDEEEDDYMDEII